MPGKEQAQGKQQMGWVSSRSSSSEQLRDVFFLAAKQNGATTTTTATQKWSSPEQDLPASPCADTQDLG